MTNGLFFSTNSSQHLVDPILLHTKLTKAQYRLGSFVDGEVMFYLDQPVKDIPCVILGHTSTPAENLLRLLTVINTLKINGAKPIVVVIPYFGYGRSDKPKPLQPINARLFASFIQKAGADKVICLNLHSQLDEHYLGANLIHLSAIPLFAHYFDDGINLSIASPDRGGEDRAMEMAHCLNQKSIVHILKSRPSDIHANVLSVTGQVEGKNILLVDDMIQTGHTLLEAAKALKKKGARQLYATVTHCIYQAKGIELLTKTSLFTKIYITNSLSDSIKLSTKVTQIDIAPLLSRSILTALT